MIGVSIGAVFAVVLLIVILLLASPRFRRAVLPFAERKDEEISGQRHARAASQANLRAFVSSPASIPPPHTATSPATVADLSPAGESAVVSGALGPTQPHHGGVNDLKHSNGSNDDSDDDDDDDSDADDDEDEDDNNNDDGDDDDDDDDDGEDMESSLDHDEE